MDIRNKNLLMELLHDADDFASLKKIDCPPIYILGGSGCILGNYLERGTFDIDFVDINYDASVGRVFRLFDRFDMLDRFVTPIADGFENRAIKIDGFIHLEYYVLSKEDIIISKLGRYSEKDIEDITLIVKNTNKALLNELIENLISKDDFSERVKEEFMKNSKKFKERFNV